MDATTPPQPPPPPEVEPQPTARQGLPFEDPQRPFIDGFIETLKLMITAPRDAYRMMEPEGDIVRPLIYAVLLGWIGVIAGQIYNIVFQGAMMSALASRMHGMNFPLTAGSSIVLMVIGPIIVLIVLFIWSALVHLCLMMVGGATKSFTATLKALAYAQTASLAQLVPMCGGLIGFVWALVLQIFGVAAAHETTEGKAAVAVLLPIVVCCLCGIVLSVVFGVGIASLIGSQH